MNRIVLLGLMAIGFVSCSSPLIGPEEFQRSINESKALVLDVRTSDEFALGHIEDAININLYHPNFDSDVSKLGKDMTIHLYCQSGNRSAIAAEKLRSKGYDVVELDGGLRAWKKAGLPLQGVPDKIETRFTMESYNAFIAEHDLIIVDFFADWCGPCRAMAPHIAKVKKIHGESLTIMKVDTDESQSVAQHFNITGIPQIKVYHKGKEVYSQVGYHSYEQLEEVISPYL